MRRRFAGLLLLVAMSLSLAQGAWASVCAGQMMGGVQSEASSDMPHMPAMEMPEMPEMPSDEDCAGGHTHDQDGGAPDEEDCPFAPAALGNGCTGAASLPARSVAELSTLDVNLSNANPAATKPHSLAATAPFHPPKA